MVALHLLEIQMKYILVVIYHFVFKQEAKSLISYMKYKLPNFMLSLRKISQDISENTYKWIPRSIRQTIDRQTNI